MPILFQTTDKEIMLKNSSGEVIQHYIRSYNTYALISKADYLASQPNYRMIVPIKAA